MGQHPRRQGRPPVLEQAIGTTKVTPVEVVTDRAATYPMVLEDLLPAAWHRTERYANNRVEAGHGRLKSRLRPMRGLNQDRNARVVVVGHAFVPKRSPGASRAGHGGADEPAVGRRARPARHGDLNPGGGYGSAMPRLRVTQQRPDQSIPPQAV
jgi:hypothetical protein